MSGYLFRLGRWLERRIAPSIRANLPTLPGHAERARGDVSDAGVSSEESEGVPAHAH